jgi:hypothetical protein
MAMARKKMLKTLQVICGLAGANLLAAAFAGPAQAITVDGILDAGYGASTATVLYDASAPIGNFQSATNKSNTVGYSIYLADQAGTLYGYLQGGPGTSLPFANLYFGLNHDQVNGSIFGFELGGGPPTPTHSRRDLQGPFPLRAPSLLPSAIISNSRSPILTSKVA